MNAMTRNALNAYSKISIDVGVTSADPHELVSMLFNGAIKSISEAKTHLQNKDIAARGKAISKAIAIIDEGLKISLDDKLGGELAQNLRALYEYMCHRLLTASVKNEIAPLDEVIGLLKELSEAWSSIKPQAAVKTTTDGMLPNKQTQDSATTHYGAA
jgi:flagellar protein FliS